MAGVATDMALTRSQGGSGGRRMRRLLGRTGIYVALTFWAFVSLFPVYWTITTSMKVAKDVQLGRLIPWVDYQPNWLGWRSLGLSSDTIFNVSTVREEFLDRFLNSIITAVGASTLAVLIGALAAYGLSRFQYRFLWMKNQDLSFFFLSQLILPPVVLALPFLVLYRELALLDSTVGLILLYTLTVLPIVIWIMKDQFDTIPIELDEAAQVDGLGPWGTFFRIIVPMALPGMVAAFILSLILCWNEYFFAALLTGADAKTLPVMVASQTGSQGINWWSMAALSAAAIAPLVIVGVLLERFIIKGLTAGSVKG